MAGGTFLSFDRPAVGAGGAGYLCRPARGEAEDKQAGEAEDEHEDCPNDAFLFREAKPARAPKNEGGAHQAYPGEQS